MFKKGNYVSMSMSFINKFQHSIKIMDYDISKFIESMPF